MLSRNVAESIRQRYMFGQVRQVAAPVGSRAGAGGTKSAIVDCLDLVITLRFHIL